MTIKVPFLNQVVIGLVNVQYSQSSLIVRLVSVVSQYVLVVINGWFSRVIVSYINWICQFCDIPNVSTCVAGKTKSA